MSVPTGSDWFEPVVAAVFVVEWSVVVVVTVVGLLQVMVTQE